MSAVSPFLRGAATTTNGGTWSLGFYLLCCFRTRPRRRQSATGRGKAGEPADDADDSPPEDHCDGKQQPDENVLVKVDGDIPDDVDQSTISTKKTRLTASLSDGDRSGVVSGVSERGRRNPFDGDRVGRNGETGDIEDVDTNGGEIVFSSTVGGSNTTESHRRPN